MTDRPPKDEGPSLADERPSGVAALPGRIERYGLARARALAVRDAIPSWRDPSRPNDHKARFRLNYCGDYLQFRHYLQQDEVRLHAARFCQLHLLCPLCAIRRGAKALERYLERYEVIASAKSGLRPFLVTLTVKDGSDLAERFLHLKHGLQRLMARARKGRGSMAGVEGAVWSYEVKRGKGSGLWHPHLHMVALAEVEPSALSLSREWQQLTGDSFIVDVRPMAEDVVSGFLEVFKYAVKFSDMEPRHAVDAWRVLRGARLLDSSGCFRGVEVPEDLTDDPLEGPYVELLYRFCRERMGYGLLASGAGEASRREGPPRAGSGPPVQVPDWNAWARRAAAIGEVAEGCLLPPHSRGVWGGGSAPGRPRRRLRHQCGRCSLWHAFPSPPCRPFGGATWHGATHGCRGGRGAPGGP